MCIFFFFRLFIKGWATVVLLCIYSVSKDSREGEKDASLTFVVEARQVGNVNEIVSPHCDINFSFFG